MEDAKGVKREKTAGELKISEYADRISAGETPESILGGLPPGMRMAVETELNGRIKEDQKITELEVPSQYQGLSAEIIDEVWVIPEYVDPEKTKSEQLRKEGALQKLRNQERKSELGVEDKNIKESHDQTKASRVRMDLGVKSKVNQSNSESVASVELMSVEDFAIWLVAESKKRNVNLAQAAAYDALTARPEFREIRVLAAFGDRTRLLDVYHQNESALKRFKEETQTKMGEVAGAVYVPGTWDHYKINYEEKERKETHKGYVTVDKDQVLTEFSPEVRQEIVRDLVLGGYRGQVKFPPIGSRALFSYDNIVLHGNDPEDVDVGLQIVQQRLDAENLRHEVTRRGIDAEALDGKKTSYTNRLAQLVEKATKEPKTDIEAEVIKLKA